MHLNLMIQIRRNESFVDAKIYWFTCDDGTDRYPVAGCAGGSGPTPVIRQLIFGSRAQITNAQGGSARYPRRIKKVIRSLHDLGRRQLGINVHYAEKRMLGLTDAIDTRLIVGDPVKQIELAVFEDLDVLFQYLKGDDFPGFTVADDMRYFMQVRLAVGFGSQPDQANQIPTLDEV
ncbi:hypothetical protein PS624_05918 [Pseudomonas fluorescens]|uniref:Uncharacterized protein n=1 Tax=Pseudomonas fluorescens TaxID=294 RepID=A0A5E6Y1K0_PSEFL|nr:hypothetical protein PS624_05918 [Pseudomonas fluorescens]